MGASSKMVYDKRQSWRTNECDSLSLLMSYDRRRGLISLAGAISVRPHNNNLNSLFAKHRCIGPKAQEDRLP